MQLRPHALGYFALIRSKTSYIHSRAPGQRSLHTFQVGDNVILKRVDDPNKASFLIRSLKEDARLETHRGAFAHQDIIGKQSRDVVKSTAGRQMRLQVPTLADWITMTPRLVTPVYPGEASLIVNLLDLHADAPSVNGNAEPLELLEAGTGHGSLTLHLARAIHAANSHLSAGTTGKTQPSSFYGDDDCTKQVPGEKRAAIIHTLDINRTYSNNAKKVVSGFRRGMYFQDVDFHVGDLDSWVNNQYRVRQSNAAFLDHIVLDLPSPHEHLQQLSNSLKVDGALAMFCPHITQILEGLQLVKRLRLPFFLEQVVELGANNSAGRPWEVRFIRTRNQKAPGEEGPPSDGPVDDSEAGIHSISISEEIKDEENALGGLDSRMKVSAPPGIDSVDYKTICRPKFGGLITAGGFLAVWKKQADKPVTNP